VTSNIDEEIFRRLFPEGREDSKFISSKIAWYSRYEIIHETLMKLVEKLR
jgi:hypothetical protein